MNLQFRVILALAAVLFVLGGTTGAYLYGRHDGSKLCVADAAETYKKEVEENADIDRQADRMDEPSLDRALSRWMR